MCTVILPGCGGVDAVSGGTKGKLICGKLPISDIQLTLHQADNGQFRPVGFALTQMDGSFELLANGATGPLWLAPGEYVCTLESAGAPVQFPEPYANPTKSPIKVKWTEEATVLELVGPPVRVR